MKPIIMFAALTRTSKEKMRKMVSGGMLFPLLVYHAKRLKIRYLPPPRDQGDSLMTRVWATYFSSGLAIGPPACSSRLSARPSQNCLGENAALSTVGAFRVPVLPPAPLDCLLPSLNALSGSWQEAQATESSADNRFS